MIKLQHILSEAQITLEDLKERYEDRVGGETFKYFQKLTSKVSLNYLHWICKMYVEYPRLILSFNHLEWENFFSLHPNKNYKHFFTIKDIGQIKTEEDVKNSMQELKDAISSTDIRQKLKDYCIGTVQIKGKGSFKVYRIKKGSLDSTSRKVAIMLGRNTRWCTTVDNESSNYYKDHIKKENLYFVISNQELTLKFQYQYGYNFDLLFDPTDRPLTVEECLEFADVYLYVNKVDGKQIPAWLMREFLNKGRMIPNYYGAPISEAKVLSQPELYVFPEDGEVQYADGISSLLNVSVKEILESIGDSWTDIYESSETGDEMHYGYLGILKVSEGNVIAFRIHEKEVINDSLCNLSGVHNLREYVLQNSKDESRLAEIREATQILEAEMNVDIDPAVQEVLFQADIDTYLEYSDNSKKIFYFPSVIKLIAYYPALVENSEIRGISHILLESFSKKGAAVYVLKTGNKIMMYSVSDKLLLRTYKGDGYVKEIHPTAKIVYMQFYLTLARVGVNIDGLPQKDNVLLSNLLTKQSLVKSTVAGYYVYFIPYSLKKIYDPIIGYSIAQYSMVCETEDCLFTLELDDGDTYGIASENFVEKTISTVDSESVVSIVNVLCKKLKCESPFLEEK